MATASTTSVSSPVKPLHFDLPAQPRFCGMQGRSCVNIKIESNNLTRPLAVYDNQQLGEIMQIVQLQFRAEQEARFNAGSSSRPLKVIFNSLLELNFNKTPVDYREYCSDDLVLTDVLPWIETHENIFTEAAITALKLSKEEVVKFDKAFDDISKLLHELACQKPTSYNPKTVANHRKNLKDLEERAKKILPTTPDAELAVSLKIIQQAARSISESIGAYSPKIAEYVQKTMGIQPIRSEEEHKENDPSAKLIARVSTSEIDSLDREISVNHPIRESAPASPPRTSVVDNPPSEKRSSLSLSRLWNNFKRGSQTQGQGK